MNKNYRLSLQAIEKDWWVTLALRATFATPYASSLLFKGGTSLSKSWGLIERLSEDVDLAIDRNLLEYSGNPTNSQVKKLKRKACEFTSTTLRAAIEEAIIELGIPSGDYSLTAAETVDHDKDPQQLILTYKSLLESLPYIQNEVQIEVSGRSLREPWCNRPIESLIDSTFPGLPFTEPAFLVPVVDPKRTFLEKAFLLHEEFSKQPEKIRCNRLSRHLYDLDILMDTEHCTKALADNELYDTIIAHRSIFNKMPGIDYSGHSKKNISFLPPSSVIGDWEDDYNKMTETMFYGETRPFDELMIRMQLLLEKFRDSAPSAN